MKERRDFYVYIYYRLDGRPAYVGKGCGDRWLRHSRKNTNPHLANLIKLAESSGASLYCEKVRENLTNEEALCLEIELIATIGREIKGGPLVNLTDGGEGTAGYVVTEEFREKRRAYMNKFFEEEENRQAVSIRMLGNRYLADAPRTPEWKARISASLIGNKRTLGYKHTEANKQAVSKHFKGKKQSAEQIEKRAAAHRGKKRSPEACENIRLGVLAARAAKKIGTQP